MCIKNTNWDLKMCWSVDMSAVFSSMKRINSDNWKNLITMGESSKHMMEHQEHCMGCHPEGVWSSLVMRAKILMTSMMVITFFEVVWRWSDYGDGNMAIAFDLLKYKAVVWSKAWWNQKTKVCLKWTYIILYKGNSHKNREISIIV